MTTHQDPAAPGSLPERPHGEVVTFVVVSDGTPSVVDTLVDVVASSEALVDITVNLVVVARSQDEAELVGQFIEGDITVVVHEGSLDEAAAVGTTAAPAGTTVLVPAGQSLDPASLAELLPLPRVGPLRTAGAGAVVSIVVPVWNQWQLTVSCLRSLVDSATTNRTPFEVIVVDNGSTDRTGPFLATLAGDIRVVANESNLGFGEACNQGAETSTAPYVLFLNNDTVVLDDWLDVLVGALEEDPRRAAVQPRLLFPDGRVNDAGGLVFRDADAANYGKWNPDPNSPQVAVRRAPDYVSGACLLVRREAFEQVAGFDPRYAPAYYEDTDLSFALRDKGWTLLYEPAATVVHLEGGTAGTDEAQGLKTHQVRNKPVFAAKWAEELRARPVMARTDLDAWAHRPQNGAGPGEDPAVIATAAVTGRRILVLDPVPPMFDRASGCRRTFELEKAFRAAGNSVVHEALQAGFEHDRYRRALSRYGIRLFASDSADPDVRARYRPGHPTDGYDLVVVGPWEVAEVVLPQLRQLFPGARLAVDSCDLHYVREEREGMLPRAELLARRERELAVYRSADHVLVVSPDEARRLADDAPGVPTSVIGNAHEIPIRVPPVTERSGAVFVGNTNHRPNVVGARWLVEEVWPLVRQVHPDAEVTLLGNDPGGAYQELVGPGVRALGWVPETTPYLDAARVSVAPLLAGAGVKGKVGEALAHGVPVVGTRVATEGMGLVEDRDVLVADDAAGFAAHVIALLEDDGLWQQLQESGRTAMAERHDIAAMVRSSQEFLAASLLGTADVRSVPAEPPARSPRPAGVAVRTFAFYLPQFHRIPENDAWWGRGFTEWTNVSRARSRFPGHDQPRLPTDLGFYDLRVPEARAEQAELARAHGIDGFIYYHYWFNGRRLLEQPLQAVLESGEPDLPFAVCWANEDWRATWDGRTGEVLLQQQYGPEDDLAHIRALLPLLRDPRYIRVQGKPLVLVYRVALLPDPAGTARTWREECRAAGVGEIHLCFVEAMERVGVDPRTLGFDASVEFAPDWEQSGPARFAGGVEVHDYQELSQRMLAKPHPGYLRYSGVTPGFDNTPRRPDAGYLFEGSTPERYGAWLEQTLDRDARRAEDEGRDEVLVFVNAWNEWAEGAVLEPCQLHGSDFLRAHRSALQAAPRPVPDVVG